MGFNKFDKGRGGRGFGGDRGGFGGPRRFGGRNDGPRQMYPAICSKCGQSCEVPFKPTGDRQVFCNNCFKSQGGPTPRFAPQNFGGRTGGNVNVSAASGISKAQFDGLNAKLDKILAILHAAMAEESPGSDVAEVKSKKVAKKETKTSAKKSKGKKK